MDNDYFSINSILAENQKIQLTFKHDIPEMGHLGGGSERDIKTLTKMQLPIWLGYVIIYSDWADFNIPAPFGVRVKKALNAHAKSVRLSGLVGSGGLWYGFGRTIMSMLNEQEASDLSEILTKTFRDRLVEVIDQAQHFASLNSVGGGTSNGDTAQAFREGLDSTERELFSLAQESAKMTKVWYEDGQGKRH